MARITFVAPMIRAAMASLEAELPAHVAAFNAEGASAVDLETPAEYVFGANDPKTAYPSVEVFVLEGTLGPFSLGQAGVGEADHDPQLVVTVWIMGDDGEVPRLYEQALGYARVVIEVISEDGKLGPDAEVSAGEDAIAYRVMPGELVEEERNLRRWRVPVVIRFRLEAVERWQA